MLAGGRACLNVRQLGAAVAVEYANHVGPEAGLSYARDGHGMNVCPNLMMQNPTVCPTSRDDFVVEEV